MHKFYLGQYWLDTSKFNDGNDTDEYDDEQDDWVNVDANTVMEKGKGYIAMGAGADFPFDPANIATNLQQSVFFDGKRLNNGDITYNVVTDNDSGDGFTNQNLIGNPYASAIDINKLYTENSSFFEGTFYFWTHDSQISSSNEGPYAYNFNNNDYATITTNGSITNTTNGSNGTSASQYIASGQSFLANVSSAGTITFKNSMRETGENNHFLRQNDSNIDRIWLNLTNGEGLYRQQLVAFHSTGTDDYRNGDDGQRMENGVSSDFYSVITNDSRRFAIQLLSTFNDTKTIPLGIEIVEAGTYEINIDHMEGVFTQGQKVYLEDTELGIIHDFDNGAYVFTSDVVDNDVRFVLRFTNEALGVDNEALDNLVVYPNSSSGIFTVFVPSQEAANIEVYDITGKVVVSQFTGSQIDLSGFAKGVYFAKIQVQDQQTVKRLIVK